jgi:hypothetical protein
MPSPLKFRLPAATDGSAPDREVNGYCNYRKDSLAIYKDETAGWQVVHKASGYILNEAIPDKALKGYPQALRTIAQLKMQCGEELANLDQLGWLFPKANGAAAIGRIKAVAQTLTGE